MIKKYFKFSAIISIGILVGRLSGYIREFIIASTFNISEQADHIILVLTLPDLVNTLLSISTLSVVLIPVLNDHKTKVGPIVIELTKKVLLISVVFYAISGLVLGLLYEPYIWVALMISFVSLIPNALTAITVSYLHFYRRFLFASLGSLVFNISIIVFLLSSARLLVIACGVIVSSCIRFFFILFESVKTPYKSLELKPLKTSYLSYNVIFFSILTNGLLYINPTVNKLIASFLSEGSTAIISYAEKIYLLPVSVFLTTFAIAMFPDLSEIVARKKWFKFKVVFRRSILINGAISILTTLVFIVMGKFIITLLFGFAGISGANINRIYSVFLGYTGAMVVAGTNAICTNILFACKKYKVIMYFSIGIISLNILLNTFVVLYLKEVVYIAIVTSFVQVLSVLFLVTYISFMLKTNQRNRLSVRVEG